MTQGLAPAHRLAVTLARAHDGLTRAGFHGACAALVVIFLAYNVEVAARYVLNAPTTWSADLVSYALCASIFLAFPEVTRSAGHVAITSLIERLPPRRLAALSRAIAGLGTVLCGLAALIVAGEAATQRDQGIETVAAFAVPKWWLTALIGYGFGNSALHLARLAGDPGARGPGVELPA